MKQAILILSLILITSALKAPLTRKPSQNSKSTPLATSNGISYTNYRDQQYTINISLGSNSQTLLVMPDSGSGFLWVPLPNLGFSNSFDCGTSTSCTDSKVPFNQAYGIGYINGTIVQDTLRIGGFAIENYKFVQAYATNGLDQNADFDGIMGLAPTAPGFADGSNNILKLLKDSQAIANASFGIYMGLIDTSVASSGIAGEIMFGGYDTAYSDGNFSSFALTSQNSWTIAAGGLYFNNQKLIAQPMNASIDSGTSYISLPSSVLQNFLNALSPVVCTQKDTVDGLLYFCPCSSTEQFDDLVVEFGEVNFTLPSYRYFSYNKTAGECMLLIQSFFNDYPLVILGDIFMQNFYTYFDLDAQTISISKLVVQSENNGLEWWGWLIIAGILVVILAVTSYFIIKNRKSTYGDVPSDQKYSKIEKSDP